MTDTASTDFPIVAPKKLIEVALPLDEINKASAREKSIRHGHPSTLHLWWARRPLAAARAVLFAQMVNDPSWKYSEEELKKPQIKSAITRKRNELFKLITQLVQWENTNNEELLNKVRAAIRESWRETCEANKRHPEAQILFNPDKLPLFHDPFAGGGSIPLEAQRLGLEVHATDLNPVAVLINKAMIEIPPKFAGRAPVGPIPPGERQTQVTATAAWPGAKGLAEDVRRYGAWMRDEAWNRIGQLYPTVNITKAVVKERPDLKKYEGKELTVIAWLWARTVVSPNPAAGGSHVPLISSWVLSKMRGNEAWIEPAVKGLSYRFHVRVGASGTKLPADADKGTKEARGANFHCLISGAAISGDYVKQEGQAGRIGERLVAIVCEGERGRVYLDPSPEQESIALAIRPSWKPNLEYAKNSRHMTPWIYGLASFGDLFTKRQLTALTTFAELVGVAREKAILAATNPGNAADDLPLSEAGVGATAYGDAVSVYLALILSGLADRMSTLCSWDAGGPTWGTKTRSTFARQALSMVWDFTEVNPFSSQSGSWENSLDYSSKGILLTKEAIPGLALQANAQTVSVSSKVISTDPPYYDNVPYADLSDYFYVWQRKCLKDIFPELFATIAVPKTEELVADSFRHKGKQEAEAFFLKGMTEVFNNIATHANSTIPVTIYYAFKQAETSEVGTGSTGWETFLHAVMEAGFSILGTWPMRTELSNRMRGTASNALASSIILVCRRRNKDISITRREFFRELEQSLAASLEEMIADPIAAIAPVDLAQAAIGPGMAIFSKYKAVLEADGSPMSVHNALIHINKAIDDYFSHAEGDLDADTRFCIDWFQQHEFEEGPFGAADVLARAKGTAVDGVREAGVIHSAKGKVRLLRVKEYPASWDPIKDSRLPIWEACHQMCRALGESESEAGALLARMPDKQDAIRQLAYRLYTICERKKWAEDALAYNELVTSWPAIVEESLKTGHKGSQMNLL